MSKKSIWWWWHLEHFFPLYTRSWSWPLYYTRFAGEESRGIFVGLGHIFQNKLYSTRDLVDNACIPCIPARTAVPKPAQEMAPKPHGGRSWSRPDPNLKGGGGSTDPKIVTRNNMLCWRQRRWRFRFRGSVSAPGIFFDLCPTSGFLGGAAIWASSCTRDPYFEILGVSL